MPTRCKNQIGILGTYSLTETGGAAICIHCGQCANVCPPASITEVYEYPQVKDAIRDKDKIVIVTGELFGTRSDAVHRDQLDKLAAYYTNYGVAESDGLTVFDETTHFDSPSLRVFGYRYFAIFYKCITGGVYEFDDDPSSYVKK